MGWFLLIMVRPFWKAFYKSWKGLFDARGLLNYSPLPSIETFATVPLVESETPISVGAPILALTVSGYSSEMKVILNPQLPFNAPPHHLFLVLFGFLAWKLVALRTRLARCLKPSAPAPMDKSHLTQDNLFGWDQIKAATVTETSCSLLHVDSLYDRASLESLSDRGSLDGQFKHTPFTRSLPQCLELSPILSADIFSTPNTSPEWLEEYAAMVHVPPTLMQNPVQEVQVSYQSDTSSRPRTTSQDSDSNGDVLFDLIKLYQQPLQYKRTRVIDEPIAEEKENSDGSQHHGVLAPVSPPALSSHFKLHNPQGGDSWQCRVGLVRTTLVEYDGGGGSSPDLAKHMLNRLNVSRTLVQQELRHATAEAGQMEQILAAVLADPGHHHETITRLQYTTSIDTGHSRTSGEAHRVVLAYKEFAVRHLDRWIKYLPGLEQCESVLSMALLIRNILVLCDGPVATSQYTASLRAYCTIASRPKAISFADLGQCMAQVVAALDIELVVPTFTDLFVATFGHSHNCGRQQALMVVGIKYYICLHQDKMHGTTGSRILDVISDALTERSARLTGPSPQLHQEIISLGHIVGAVFSSTSVNYKCGHRLQNACNNLISSVRPLARPQHRFMPRQRPPAGAPIAAKPPPPDRLAERRVIST